MYIFSCFFSYGTFRALHLMKTGGLRKVAGVISGAFLRSLKNFDLSSCCDQAEIVQIIFWFALHSGSC